jgi:1-deoxy-D-xylulose-5-phosphate reductoisomerase
MLGAFNSWQAIVEQAKAFHPDTVVLVDEHAAAQARAALRDCGSATIVESGEQALADAVSGGNVAVVMAAIVGAAGLAPTLAAVRRGALVALANKEVMVCAGALVTAEARRCGARLLPVDSEHNAIFQVFDFDEAHAIERIVLTASGGPFRERPLSAMAAVTPAEAVAHPNWRMGAKISVDSATMMNKGLEVIEAHHLFDLPGERVEVVVHPQSVVHGLVYYKDGSVLAQLGSPDMRTPIANALGWPQRLFAPSPRLDLAALGRLTFERPDPERFPALRLARAALLAGGGAPTVLNAANEIAVAAFLDGRVGFLDIAAIVEETLEALPDRRVDSLDDVYECDRQAREVATRLAGNGARRVAGG